MLGTVSLASVGWVFGAALGATLVTGPLVRGLAIKLDFFDRPDAGLKPHEKPIPYLGGLAIYCGWLAGLLTAVATNVFPINVVLPLLMAGTILMLVGLVDDIRHLPPKLRLLVQAGAALPLALTQVGESAGITLLSEVGVGVTGIAVTVLVALFAAGLFAGATNSTNLIDGLDGLCAGVTAVAAASFVVAFWQAAATSFQNVGMILALATVGGCVGFLFYNFKPASMFMGDSGSLLLGGALASMILIACAMWGWRGLVAGLFFCGVPIMDTSLAIVRRKLNGKPLFIGDRSHFYDQLRDHGCGVRQTVLICYAVGAVFGVVGNLCLRLDMVAVIAIAVIVPVVLAVTFVRFGFLRVDNKAESTATDKAAG